MIAKRSIPAVAAFAMASLVLSSCQSGGAQTSSPEGLTTVTVRTGFLFSISQFQVSYLNGIEKGYFEEEGLVLDLQEGQGSGNTVQLIANGQVDFGVAIASGAVIRAVSEGAEVKMVGATVPFNSLAVISKESAPIRTPSDLVGKRIGIPPGTEQAQLWPAFLSINDIDPASFELTNLSGDALPGALDQDRLDGYVSYAIDLPLLEDIGLDPAVMLFADFGLAYAPGEGVVVHQDTIDERPEIVRAFLRAMKKTIDYATSNPEDTAAVGAVAMPESIDEGVAFEILEIINSYREQASQGGYSMRMEDSAWGNTVDVLATYADLANPLPPSDYYTNDYLP